MRAWWTTLVLVIFALVVLLVAAVLVADHAYREGILSDTTAIPGNEISQALKRRIAAIVGLRQNERIHYFYSAGFTTAGDGNLFTNERVISYHVEDGTTHVWDCDHSDIHSLDFFASDTWIDDSWIEVTRNDGEKFVLYVSTESDLDHAFYDLLREQVDLKRGRE